MSAPRDPAWTSRMAHQVAKRVRWSARLSWLAAALTVVGTAAVILAPESADGPGLTDVVFQDAPPTAPGVALSSAEAPVRVRLVQVPGGEDGPVDIQF